MQPLVSRNTTQDCKDKLNDWHAVSFFSQTGSDISEERRHEWRRCRQDGILNKFILKLSKVLKGMRLYVLSSYPSNFPSHFPLCSISSSHLWSMHSVHLCQTWSERGPPLLAAPRSFLREAGIEVACAQMGPKTVTHCSDPPSIHPSCLASRLILILSYKVRYVVDSDWRTGHQLGSIPNKRQPGWSWATKLNTQMASNDIEERYCFCVPAAKSDESITKESII